MNLIIELIIKIFQAIFEEDRHHRDPSHLARRGEREGAPRGAPQHGQSARTMEQWLHNVLDPETPPPPARYPPRTQGGGYRPAPTTRPPVQRTQTARRKTKPPSPPQRKVPPAPVVQPTVPIDLVSPSARKKRFKVPGKSPLARLMYGQIILGPCKAKGRTLRSG